MVSMGLVELMIVALGLLISLAIPTVALVVGVLIYRRLGRIEEALRQREEDSRG